MVCRTRVVEGEEGIVECNSMLHDDEILEAIIYTLCRRNHNRMHLSHLDDNYTGVTCSAW